MATGAREAPWAVAYCDGSGNGFRFWQEAAGEGVRFAYSPVTPETSSSGTFSGGEAKSGQLDAERVEELWGWVRRLESDTSGHAASRMKGTGAFELTTPAGSLEFVVGRGPPLREFDEFVEPFRGEPPFAAE